MQIIDKEINPFVDKWEEEEQFPAHKVFKILGQAGFLGVTKPTGRGIHDFKIIQLQNNCYIYSPKPKTGCKPWVQI